jgi:GPH family glycoside/pentoside/hexuronide:cation symporter
VVLAFSLPTLGVGFMFLLVSLYLMKFATDVLLISPAAMGTIFGISRIWDAVSDPVSGFLSDRTRSPLGRRRPWLLASIPLIALTFVLMWNPPSSLSPASTTVWMACSIVGFYTAMTVFIVPHQSLGAELTSDYHGRSRVFAWRHIVWSMGSVAAVVVMQILIDDPSPRAAAGVMGLAVAGVSGLLILWAVVRLRERPEYQGRGADSPFSSYGDVWRNRHARLLLVVFLIESLGGATIGILTPYVAQYIVGRPDLTSMFIAFYMIPTIASTPIWPVLARRFGKKQLWLFSMVLTGLSFGGMFFISEGSVVLISVLAALAGTAAGCGSIMSPSIQSDIIDYDEYETGERKEGSYFAAWNFTFKSATGVTLMLTGLVLEWSGFTPNAEQTQLARGAILALYSLFPFVCYAIGALLFSRFSLDEAEHARIQSELDRRARDAAD